MRKICQLVAHDIDHDEYNGSFFYFAQLLYPKCGAIQLVPWEQIPGAASGY